MRNIIKEIVGNVYLVCKVPFMPSVSFNPYHDVIQWWSPFLQVVEPRFLHKGHRPMGDKIKTWIPSSRAKSYQTTLELFTMDVLLMGIAAKWECLGECFRNIDCSCRDKLSSNWCYKWHQTILLSTAKV